jgi:hypothetical protein
MHTDICAAPGPTGAAQHFLRRASGSGLTYVGIRSLMSDSSVGDDSSDRSGPEAGDRVGQRAAELLPEERAAGSADPQAQAAAILQESDEREGNLEAAPSSFLEHRTSDQSAG